MTENLSFHLSTKSLLENPVLNKGLAFSKAERDAFGLHALLPPAVRTLEEQLKTARMLLDDMESPFARHIYLRSIQDSNETLFYALIASDLETMLPLIYTPTVGEACQKFSTIWQRPRGLFLSYEDRENMEARLAHPALDDVRVIVVSDGERILGLGDQGAGGMGIPIGKLSLYTACAGIAPQHTLPILLDTGTDNEARLADPSYIGSRHKRVRGAEYDAFIEQFVECVMKRWPHVLLQWEDFAGVNAARLLARYRDQLCTFNDDIQGTASVAAGAILAANQASGKRLSDQTIVMLGAGSAGVGIARLLLAAIEDEDTPHEEARQRFYMLDKDGLLTAQRVEMLDEGQKLFARDDWSSAKGDLATLIDTIDAAILIGVSGVAGVFSEEIIRNMTRKTERPIIFPLSNPTSHAEATPEDIMRWTDGKALVSTGSPFPPLPYKGTTRRVDQTNNSYIFPGMGLGIIACRAMRVTEAMFMAAAKKLAALSPLHQDPDGNLLPPVTQLRDVARDIAIATALQARADGVCAGFSDDTLDGMIDQHIWSPQYKSYSKARV
ncbi:MAG: NAD-dependent malic enzyme [Acetobacteraceae bacterium]